jgi:hypothetical protein
MSTRNRCRLTVAQIFPHFSFLSRSRNTFRRPVIGLKLRRLFPSSGKCFETPEIVLARGKKFPECGNCFECFEIVFSAQKLFEAFGRSSYPLKIVLTIKAASTAANAEGRREDTIRSQVFFPPPSRTHPPPIFLLSPSLLNKEKTKDARPRPLAQVAACSRTCAVCSSFGGVRERKESGGGGARGGGAEKLGALMVLAPALSDFAEAMVFGWRKFLRTVKTYPRELVTWRPAKKESWRTKLSHLRHTCRTLS